MPLWLWAAALLPRLVLFLLAVQRPGRCLEGDSVNYLALAGTWLRTGSFATIEGSALVPEVLRTPAYPAFLVPFVALLPDGVLAAALAQCLLGAATVALLWKWSRRFGGEAGAAVAALVLALDLGTVLHTPLLFSETLFTFLQVAALIRLWPPGDRPRPGAAAGSGFLWSLAAMVRPVSLYLPVLVCWVWRRDRRSIAAFLLAAYLLPGLWTARNHATTGHWTFSTIGGVQLLRFPAAGIEALRTGRPHGELERELEAKAATAWPGGVSNEAQRAAAYSAAAWPILAAHPFLLAQHCAWGALKILGGTGVEMLLKWTDRWDPEPAVELGFHPKTTGRGTLNLLRRHPALIPVQLLYLLFLAALYLLAGAGLWRLWRDGRWRDAGLLACVAAYFLALTSIGGYYRYRLPLIAPLAACAAAAVPWLSARRRGEGA